MTPMPASPFMNPSVISPRTERSAVVSKPPPAADATAAPNSALASAMTADTAAGPGLTDPSVPAAVLIDEPSPDEGRPEEASAPAPTKNPDADALGTEFIHEIFFYARRLLKDDRRFVLDQAAFMAEVEEIPLFVRDGDHLRRWSA